MTGKFINAVATLFPRGSALPVNEENSFLYQKYVLQWAEEYVSGYQAEGKQKLEKCK